MCIRPDSLISTELQQSLKNRFNLNFGILFLSIFSKDVIKIEKNNIFFRSVN